MPTELRPRHRPPQLTWWQVVLVVLGILIMYTGLIAAPFLVK